MPKVTQIHKIFGAETTEISNMFHKIRKENTKDSSWYDLLDILLPKIWGGGRWQDECTGKLQEMFVAREG